MIAQVEGQVLQSHIPLVRPIVFPSCSLRLRSPTVALQDLTPDSGDPRFSFANTYLKGDVSRPKIFNDIVNVISGLERPAGRIFAGRVVSFMPGTYLFGAVPPAPGDEVKALGAPDGRNVPLGLGGQLTVELTSPLAVDNSGGALEITAFFPTGQELDNQAQVFVSADGVSFISAGSVGPGSQSFLVDLIATGLSQVRFVRIVDSGNCCLSGNPEGGGDGFNVESIEALKIVLPPEPGPCIQVDGIICLPPPPG